MTTLFNFLPGKSDPGNPNSWLPLWMHNFDTAGIMAHLINDWLPDEICGHISAQITNGTTFEQLCRFLSLTHDIGKATPLFACRICRSLPEIRDLLYRLGLLPPPEYKFPNEAASPHSIAGEAILRKYGVPNGIASIVGAHHGKPRSLNNNQHFSRELVTNFVNYYGNQGEDSEQGQAWKKLRFEWFELALKKSGYESAEMIPELDMASQFVLSGLLIMADWIASNTVYFPLIPLSENGSESDYYPERAERAWEKLDLPSPWESGLYFIDDQNFESEFGFAPNPVQRSVIDAISGSADPGICMIEAPMGCGKTEAALAAAELMAAKKGCGGIFFGLPTQATANGIFPRLLNWAERESEDTVHSIRLAHGMAELNEDYRALFTGDSHNDDESGAVTVHQWFSGRKQALLADFVIGTVDQLLMAALKQKHVMLRHLGLAGKVVIIDECHAYDAYMNRYLERALMWLGAYGVPVILLSATLPISRRSELIDAYLGRKAQKSPISVEDWRSSMGYPLITWTDGGIVRQTIPDAGTINHKVEFKKLSEEDIASYLVEKLSDGGCAGVIANTVRRSQDIALTLREKLPDCEIILIHSSFAAPDRASKEDIIRKRLGRTSKPDERDRLIIVGTQVLEQSLDIDFDIMITDLCPMDLLLQRVGRLHRHERLRPDKLNSAVCALLGADGELEPGSRKVYSEWLLMRTRKLLPDFAFIPESIPALVQAAYSEPSEEEENDLSLAEALQAHRDMIAIKECRAGIFLIAKPERKINKFHTIAGILDTDLTDDEKQGEAAVRDIKPNINVLLMVRRTDGLIGFLPGQDAQPLSPGHVPSDEEARRIAVQKIALPYIFALGDNYDKTVNSLEKINIAELSEWQKSGWLRGELILLLNEELRCELCGFELEYSPDYGLTYKKMEGDNNG